ncbi:hypothetical protein LOK49_LG11G00795 [Camellia lanceoleosa]|uniref:Uncharacterized protein n=1 Tax=Camellia lanceoleosa TaxID=1840588 RepID=A0ACC0G2F3_9ERIC|nr:hypothetical protein LOK49_LG11G00795 [Camellia lanceoleosa]
MEEKLKWVLIVCVLSLLWSTEMTRGSWKRAYIYKKEVKNVYH